MKCPKCGCEISSEVEKFYFDEISELYEEDPPDQIYYNVNKGTYRICKNGEWKDYYPKKVKKNV